MQGFAPFLVWPNLNTRVKRLGVPHKKPTLGNVCVSIQDEVDQSTAVDNPGLSKFLVCSSVIIFGVGQSLLFVILGPVALEIGLTPVQFGAVFSASNIFLLAAGPFWGKRSDVIGRKPVLLVGLAGTFIGTLLLAAVLQIGLWQMVTVPILMALLFFARSVYSILATSIYPASGAYMADITTRQDRAKGMALIGASNSMGSMLGPLLGAVLVTFSVLLPLYVAAGAALIGGIVLYVKLQEPRRKKNGNQVNTLKPNDKRIYPFMIVWAVFFLVFTTLQLSTPFYIGERFGIEDPKELSRWTGFALLTLAAVNIVVQIGVLQLVRFHPRNMLRICLPMFAISLLVIGFAQTYWVLLLGYGILGLGFSFANPGINGSASLSVNPEEQGVASGLIAASTTAGVVLGPILGTTLYEIQLNLPMIIGSIVAAITAIYAFTIKVPDPKPYIPAASGDAEPEKA